MNDEQQHVALPKLYGAPAYARPKVVPVATADKPFDPDDLPLQAYQTSDERDWSAELPARAYQPGGGVHVTGRHASVPGASTRTAGPGALPGKPLSLRALAGRFLGTGEDR